MEYGLKLKHIYYSGLLILILLTGSFFIWQFTRTSRYELGVKNIEQKSRDVSKSLEVIFEQNWELAEDGEALFSVNANLNRLEFINFFEKRDQEFEGMTAIAYVEKVTNKSQFTEKVKSDQSVSRIGYPDFKIFPETNSGEVYVINYLTNYKDYKSLMGFDISSNEIIREKINKAVESGNTVVIPRQLFLNVYRAGVLEPVYENYGEENLSPAEKKLKLKGLILILIDTDKLTDFWSNTKDNTFPYKLTLYDESVNETQLKSKKSILEKYLGNTQTKIDPKRQVTKLTEIKVLDNTWTIGITSSYLLALNQVQIIFPDVVFFINSIFSLLFGILFYYYLDNRKLKYT